MLLLCGMWHFAGFEFNDFNSNLTIPSTDFHQVTTLKYTEFLLYNLGCHLKLQDSGEQGILLKLQPAL